MLQTVQQRDRRERFSQLFGAVLARRERCIQLPPPELAEECIAGAGLFGTLDPDLVCAIAEQLAQTGLQSCRSIPSVVGQGALLRKAKQAIADIASLLCTCRCIESAFREQGDMLRLEVAARGQTQLWPVNVAAQYPFLDQVLREERSRLDVRMLESALTAMVTHCASNHCRGARWAHNKRIAEATQRQEQRPATPLLLAVLSGGERTPRVKVAWSGSARGPRCIECFGSAAAAEDCWVLAADEDGGDLVRVQNAPAPAFDPRSELAKTRELRGVASISLPSSQRQQQYHATHLAVSPCGGWLALAYQESEAHHADNGESPAPSFMSLDEEALSGSQGGGTGGVPGQRRAPNAHLRLWRMHKDRAPELTSEVPLANLLVRSVWMRLDDSLEATGVVLVMLTRSAGVHSMRQCQLTGSADDLGRMFRHGEDCIPSREIVPRLHTNDLERNIILYATTHLFSVEPSDADGGRTCLCTLVGRGDSLPQIDAHGRQLWQILVVCAGSTTPSYFRVTEAVTGLDLFLKRGPLYHDSERCFLPYSAKASPCQTLVVALGSRLVGDCRRLHAHIYRKRVEDQRRLLGDTPPIKPFELVHSVHIELAIRRAPSSRRAECDGVRVHPAPTCFCFSSCGRFAIFALERVEMQFPPGRGPCPLNTNAWDREVTAGMCFLDLSQLSLRTTLPPRVDFGWVQCRDDLLPRRMRWNRAGLWLGARSGVLLLGA
jgi:hypothetical protein